MLVNWGLAITILGTVVLIVAGYKLDPVNAFRETNGDLEFRPELLIKLRRQLRLWVMTGVGFIGLGTIIQMTGNLIG